MTLSEKRLRRSALLVTDTTAGLAFLKISVVFASSLVSKLK